MNETKRITLLCCGKRVTGIRFLLLEKDNKFVRFHAIQSILVFGAYTVLAIILGFIPVVGWIYKPTPRYSSVYFLDSANG